MSTPFIFPQSTNSLMSFTNQNFNFFRKKKLTLKCLPTSLSFSLFKEIVDAIPKKITALRIVSSHLNDVHLYILAKSHLAKKITDLDLSDNKISFSGVYAISKFFTNLEKLYLDKNSLDKTGFEVPRLLRKFPKLKLISVRDSKFDPGYEADSDVD